MTTESAGVNDFDGSHLTETLPNFFPGLDALHRQARRIPVFLSDYLPDAMTMKPEDRTTYYTLLKDKLGFQFVRTEVRMGEMIKPDGSFDEEVFHVYGDSLRAMKEAGLDKPAIVLFSPAKWMHKLADENPEEFFTLYQRYAEKVRDLCGKVDVQPRYIQVFNELNFPMQTSLSLEQSVRLIEISHNVFKVENQAAEKPSIITTVYTNASEKPPRFPIVPKGIIGKIPFWNDWRAFVKELTAKVGDKLDGIGFDYYPGSWDTPAIRILGIGRKPFDAFGVITPYHWIVDQKLRGILKDKDIFLSEIGVPGISRNSDFSRFGYDRIVQSLDHFLLSLQREGHDVNKIFSGIGFFRGADFTGVGNKAIGGLDAFPWVLIRKDENNEWTLTSAGRRLKHLIKSRLDTHVEEEGVERVFVGSSESRDGKYLREKRARKGIKVKQPPTPEE